MNEGVEIIIVIKLLRKGAVVVGYCDLFCIFIGLILMVYLRFKLILIRSIGNIKIIEKILASIRERNHMCEDNPRGIMKRLTGSSKPPIIGTMDILRSLSLRRLRAFTNIEAQFIMTIQMASIKTIPPMAYLIISKGDIFSRT